MFKCLASSPHCENTPRRGFGAAKCKQSSFRSTNQPLGYLFLRQLPAEAAGFEDFTQSRGMSPTALTWLARAEALQKYTRPQPGEANYAEQNPKVCTGKGGRCPKVSAMQGQSCQQLSLFPAAMARSWQQQIPLGGASLPVQAASYTGTETGTVVKGSRKGRRRCPRWHRCTKPLVPRAGCGSVPGARPRGHV